MRGPRLPVARSRGARPGGRLEGIAPGASCIAVGAETFALQVWFIQHVDEFGPILMRDSDSLRLALLELVTEGYQGEVLVTDGQLALQDAHLHLGLRALPLGGPHWVCCGCRNDDLWVFNDATSSTRAMGVRDVVRRAKLTPASKWEGIARRELDNNLRYTMFVEPQACEVALDLRKTFTNAAGRFTATGALVGDLDVVMLASGWMRMSFISEAAGYVDGDPTDTRAFAGGLVVAYGAPGAREKGVVPDYGVSPIAGFDFDPVFIEESDVTRPAIMALARRFRQLGRPHATIPTPSRP